MKIKRIEICGFKSFVDKTAISFPDAITSIVGPNGCGKSNVVDAIRWVMGEQSAKHLRGRAMEDVIFSGSESRGPAGLAEVSLTFDARGMASDVAPDGVPWGAVGPEEIVVTRRLHRDGESEYLLNGVPSRLRDVVEFFLGTGVGSKAYAIIEQGRIGFIVSSRPEDRRGLIDEAAGITKYKTKKRAAERRMESTRHHLLRVSDIVGEIEGRLRSLRLQAQKAERYKRYKGELKDLDLWSSAQRFLGHLAEEKSLAAELEVVRGQRESVSGTLEVEETSIEAERLSVTEEAHELASAKDELFALSNKAQLGMQRAQHGDDEASQLLARAEAARREIAELTARATEQAAAIEELDGQLARFEEDAQASQGAYSEKEAEHESLRAALGDARRELDGALSELGAARARIARNEAERAAAEQRRDDLAMRIEGLVAEESTAAERVTALTADDEGLRASLTAVRARRDDRTTRKQAAAEHATSLKGDVARGELELETLREEAHRRRSRLASLSEIQNRYESFQKGVRAIMQHRESLSASGHDGIRGVVADIVQPPPDLETAVEAVLGDRLGNIIVESHEVGLEAIEFLKKKSEGRSSFIPVGLRGTAPFPMAMAPAGEVVYDATGGAMVASASAPVYMPMPDASAWPTGEGVRGPLLDLIGYDRQYDKIATYLMGDVVVVENLRRALELWRETKTTKTIVTLEGEVIDPQGVVTGGAKESAVAGVLEQKREIRELEEIVARLEADTQDALARHVGKKQQLADITAELDQLSAELRTDEMELFGQQKDLDRATEELRRFEYRRAQLETQVADLGRSRQDAERRAETAQEALAVDAVVAETAAERGDELRAHTTELGAQLDGVVATLTALKVAAAQAEDRRRNALAMIARLRAERSEHQARAERLGQTISDETARAETLRADALSLRDEASLWQAEAEARARAHHERQDALEDRQTRLAQREAELRVTRADDTRLAQTLNRLELRHQEVALKRTSLEEHVSDRYRDVTLADVVQDFHLRPLFSDVEEERAKELRGLIERMGEINLTAIEESEELQARFDFLTTQRADLESAISQLEMAIEKINRASRKRFRETFDAVNDKFKEVFPRMFGGGHAHLSLTDDGDLLETGIEIIANPPGKKISQNIELLSGGEKALTAVSLLFAIFLIKPSPFCVLDEVDAPLDEANVGRFNQAVREMTDRSQFIIITHNRRTMEIADRLCGITMEEPGVSKLVAVNLRGSKSAKRPAVDSAAGHSAPAAQPSA